MIIYLNMDYKDKLLHLYIITDLLILSILMLLNVLIIWPHITVILLILQMNKKIKRDNKFK